MGIVWNIARVAITAIIVVAVAELSKRSPRLGALLLSIPIVSILAFTIDLVDRLSGSDPSHRKPWS